MAGSIKKYVFIVHKVIHQIKAKQIAFEQPQFYDLYDRDSENIYQIIFLGIAIYNRDKTTPFWILVKA